MKKLICAAAVLLSMFAPVANAAGYSYYVEVQQLVSQAKSNAYDGNTFVLAFIMGVNDITNGNLTCVPANIKAQTLRDLVFVYVDSNNVGLHDSAAEVVRRALQSRFPC